MLSQWELIVQDFGDNGIDLWDARYDERPWSWFESRLQALLNRPVIYAPSGAAIYQTRLARHFYQREAFEAVERELERQRSRR